MALDNAKRSRGGQKSWLTRAARSLEQSLETKDLDVIEDKCSVLDSALTKFQTSQSVVEGLLTTQEELDADIEAADAYLEDTVYRVRVKAKKLLRELSEVKPVPVSTEKVEVQLKSENIHAKLPKLELPRFSGDVTLWSSFYDQFEAIVDNSKEPTITKFVYLRSLLDGEALDTLKGLTLTESNYVIALDLLKDRYGRKELIIFAHIQGLLNMQVGHPSAQALRKVQEGLLSHVRSLEALGIDNSSFGVILTPLILSKLPEDIRIEWARVGKGRESDLTFLLEFLKEEIEIRERSDVYHQSCDSGDVAAKPRRSSKDPCASVVDFPGQRRKTSTSTASAATLTVQSSCGVCGKSHMTDSCFKLTRARFKDRRSVLRNSHLCFRCLSDSHLANVCSVVCAKCNGNHHALICKPKQSNPPGNHVPPVAPSAASISASSQPTSSSESHQMNLTVRSEVSVLMQTAQVMVSSGRGESVPITVLFDTGSDRTYVSQRLVSKLQPPFVRAEPLRYGTFGAEKLSVSQMRNIYHLSLQGTSSVESVEAVCVPVICAPLYSTQVTTELLTDLGLQNMQFCSTGSGQVDLLIGLDCYWRLMCSDIRHVGDNLVAQQSKFGWILSGCVSKTVLPEPSGSFQLLIHSDLADDSLRRLWTLDAVGISGQEDMPEDPVWKKFKEDLEFVGGRYSVALPWKEDRRDLKDNRAYFPDQ